jgi:hypothetical protein
MRLKNQLLVLIPILYSFYFAIFCSNSFYFAKYWLVINCTEGNAMASSSSVFILVVKKAIKFDTAHC